MIAKNLARQKIRDSKKKTWEEFVESINSNTNVKEIYNKIRRIEGKNSFKNISFLKENDINISDRTEICNVLGKAFENISSSQNYNPAFINNQKKIDINFYKQHLTNIGGPLNSEIKLKELECSSKNMQRLFPRP